MLNRLPQLARHSRFLSSSSLHRPTTSLAVRTTAATPLRLASTHSAAEAAKHHDDHGHGDGHGHGHGHEDHYDPPGGWLWGERPGDKYEKEGWEGLAWVFVASWVVAIAAYTMKEDTSYVLPLPSRGARSCSCVAQFTFALVITLLTFLGYKHGPWKKRDDGSKRKAFMKNQNRFSLPETPGIGLGWTTANLPSSTMLLCFLLPFCMVGRLPLFDFANMFSAWEPTRKRYCPLLAAAAAAGAVDTDGR